LSRALSTTPIEPATCPPGTDCSRFVAGDTFSSSNLNAVFKLNFIKGVKVHLISTAQTKLGFLRRVIVAAVLVLALLSGVVPFGAASAGHLCTMECCAALPPHTAGSCHMSMSSKGSEPQQESNPHCGLPQDNGAADGIVAGVMGMTGSDHSSSNLDDVTIDASDHCKADSHSEDLNAPSRNDSPESATIATQSFSKPCPPECGAGTLSSGVGRSTEELSAARQGHPQPPSGRKYQRFDQSFLITSTYYTQLRPRGPPSSIN